MKDNTGVLADLFDKRQIRMEKSPFLDTAPAPLPQPLNLDRVEGMLLGLAIGDALGNTTEGATPGERLSRHGLITGYLPNRHADGRPVGLPSDDSQMAFWTLEQLSSDNWRLVPEHLSKRFSNGRKIFGIGKTVRTFRENRDKGADWSAAGDHSAGNGAVMRIAPVLIPHLPRPSPALWADVAIAGMITHNDHASNASCVALASLLWNCLGSTRLPARNWWLDEFVRVSGPLEGNTHLKLRFGPHRASFDGSLSKYLDDVLRAMILSDEPVLEAGHNWGSGAYLMETIPSVLAILTRHAGSPKDAILAAVNDTKDNDTIGAIVGAVVGALHGRKALPQEWIDGLLGRTAEHDDGRVFELIEKTKGFLKKTTANGPATSSTSVVTKPASDVSDRFRGCLLGLAVGDAVGTAVEFKARGTFAPITGMVGGGPFNLNAGEWTDDTSMALCLAASLVETGGFDARDQMDRYCRWNDEGYMSSNGRCFDIGNTVSAALRRYRKTGDPIAGSTDPNSAGNGCIMRLAPVPMFYFASQDEAIRYSGESSRTTHATAQCVESSRLFGSMVWRALAGEGKEEVLFSDSRLSGLSPKIAAIAAGEYRSKRESEIRGSGYVVESLEAALWCFLNTSTYEDAVLRATNLGGDADTTAAICGQIAGAFYGMDGIPARWLQQLCMRDEMVALADRLRAGAAGERP